MDQLIQLERKIQESYDTRLRPLAERLGFDLPMSRKDAVGQPTVLFLGNHSSGKSSFINYVIGADIQKTGLAPVDDGFTIITYAEKKDEYDGNTVVTHPELVYKNLQQFGPNFLARLKLKTAPHEILKHVSLIDSPGMIDAVGEANTRGYDFRAAVRYFAESVDLILFFFDPEKPGTTGETISIITETLAGLEYKLHIILNKVDAFEDIRDFARTYGTLCWNLAKMIKTKDIPQIYTNYIPSIAAANSAKRTPALPLVDFDSSREELISSIQRAPTRRADNLVTALFSYANRLEVHAKICAEVGTIFARYQIQFWLAALIIVSLTTLAGLFIDQVFTRDESFSMGWILGGGVLLLGIARGWYLWQCKRLKDRYGNSAGLDGIFKSVYRRELDINARPDLWSLWENVKAQSVSAVRSLPLSALNLRSSGKKLLGELEEAIDTEIPNLRREIGEFHRRLKDEGAFKAGNNGPSLSKDKSS